MTFKQKQIVIWRTRAEICWYRIKQSEKLNHMQIVCSHFMYSEVVAWANTHTLKVWCFNKRYSNWFHLHELWHFAAVEISSDFTAWQLCQRHFGYTSFGLNGTNIGFILFTHPIQSWHFLLIDEHHLNVYMQSKQNRTFLINRSNSNICNNSFALICLMKNGYNGISKYEWNRSFCWWDFHRSINWNGNGTILNCPTDLIRNNGNGHVQHFNRKYRQNTIFCSLIYVSVYSW